MAEVKVGDVFEVVRHEGKREICSALAIGTRLEVAKVSLLGFSVGEGGAADWYCLAVGDHFEVAAVSVIIERVV